MILKKYLISASAMAVLSTSVVPQVIANNELRNQEMIVKTEKESGVSISAPNKTIKKGDKFNPMTGVSAKDFDGSDITRHIIVTHNNVNVDRAGVYKVGYAVLGKNGKRVDIEVTITVVGESGDTFNTEIIAEDIVLKKGSKFNPMDGVKAIDVTGSDITQHVLVTKNNVDTKNIGKYEVTYLVLDTKGNRVYKTRVVEVKEDGDVSKKETIIVAEDKTIEKGTSFDPMKGVKAIDVTGKDITQHVLVVENTVNPDKVSVGTVKYLVLDTEGNRVYKTIKVTVANGDETPRTEIIAEDITLNTGDVFEEKKGVQAIDITGRDITQHILVTKNNINTNKPGDYEVTYLVLDSENNRVYKTIKVHVVGEPILTNEEKAQAVIDKIETLNKVITYGDGVAVKEARKAYDSLNSEAKLMVTNLDVLESAESQLDVIREKINKVNDAISNLPKEITLADKSQVEKVREAYEALTEEEKTAILDIHLSVLVSAELTIDALERIESDKLIAQSLVERIDALSEDVLYSEAEEMRAIRDVYENLVPSAQDLVTNYDKLKDLLNKLNHVIESIMHVEYLISIIPENIELQDVAKVEDAKKAYDALSVGNQASVKQDMVEKLKNAEAEVQKLKDEVIATNDEVRAVISEIEALPELDAITIDNKAEVFGAMARFRALPEEVQFAVDTTSLFNSFDKVEGFMVEEVSQEIADLPAIEDLQISDKTTIEGIRTKYEEISERNNGKVANLDVLVNAEAKIKELESLSELDLKIKSIIAKIELLEDVITYDNIEAEKVKVNEIDALIDEVGVDNISSITNIEKLEDVKLQIQVLDRVPGSVDVSYVIDAINNLPEVIDIQYSHEDVIIDARNAFNKLNPDDKLLVLNITKLEEAEAEYKRIEDGINEVITAIHQIPALEDITIADRDVILEARRVYNSHDSKVTHYVNYINVGELLNAEIKLEKLERLETDAEAKALVEKIDALAKKGITLEDKDAVVELRNIYDSLEPDSQRAIINIHLLREMEEKIKELEKENI